MALFEHVRSVSTRLVSGLSDADATVQSMEDASPAKWHLAHTTWFFETFISGDALPGYVRFDEQFAYVFNSYYESQGARHPRPLHGLLTRPSLDEVLAYRAHVDRAMRRLPDAPDSARIDERNVLGCHHEQQHQELLLTDIAHLFSHNALQPAFRAPEPLPADNRDADPIEWSYYPGGLQSAGHHGQRFAFDCEGPRHDDWLAPSNWHPGR